MMGYTCYTVSESDWQRDWLWSMAGVSCEKFIAETSDSASGKDDLGFIFKKIPSSLLANNEVWGW